LKAVGDALVIKIGRTKNDQEGKMAWPRHVYANPFEPTICPILSLGLLVFTLGARREGMSALVFDVNVKESFASWLHRICVDEDERMTEIGVSVKDIGTHSLRKGVSTALSNSPAVSVQIYICWGWRRPASWKSCCRAGHEWNRVRALPPHFTRQALTIAEWEAVLPGYRTFYPRGFCSVLPFLLASIVYHAEFLKISLHPSHPFFLSLLWSSGHLAKLKSQVMTGYMRNATSCMIASGIPPHVALSERFCTVENTLRNLADTLTTTTQSLPDAVCSRVVASISAVGSLNEEFKQLCDKLTDLLDRPHAGVPSFSQSISSLPAPSLTAITDNTPRHGFPTHTWRGRLHIVPQGFRFPTCKVQDLWNLWWNGVSLDGIGPLRLVTGCSIQKCDATNFSKAKQVMKKLLTFTEINEKSIAQMTVSLRSELFFKVFDKTCKHAYGDMSNDE
ncbi:hypothetical protein AeRB84_019197, partial [Aphanomyces euteiches]